MPSALERLTAAYASSHDTHIAPLVGCYLCLLNAPRAPRPRSPLEVHPGVFVSNVATDAWRPDPEVGGDMHVLVERAGAYAGMSRFLHTANPEPWVLPERETVLIVEGAAQIEIAGGPTLQLQVGDLASLPKGALTTWHLTLPFKELWFFGRAYEMATG